MKKNSTCLKSPKRNKSRERSITIGMDLGDKTSHYYVLDSEERWCGKAPWRRLRKG